MENLSNPEKNIGRLRLTPNSVVADLGAGTGHYALAIGRKLKGLSGKGVVYAVDVQKELLARLKQEALRKGLSNIEVIWGDVDVPGGVKLAPESCDAVVISNVLFQSSEKEKFLREAARILKRGGEIMIIDWQVQVSAEEITKFAQAAQLKERERFNAGAHHFGIIFHKP